MTSVTSYPLTNAPWGVSSGGTHQSVTPRRQVARHRGATAQRPGLYPQRSRRSAARRVARRPPKSTRRQAASRRSPAQAPRCCAGPGRRAPVPAPLLDQSADVGTDRVAVVSPLDHARLAHRRRAAPWLTDFRGSGAAPAHCGLLAPAAPGLPTSTGRRSSLRCWSRSAPSGPPVVPACPRSDVRPWGDDGDLPSASLNTPEGRAGRPSRCPSVSSRRARGNLARDVSCVGTSRTRDLCDVSASAHRHGHD